RGGMRTWYPIRSDAGFTLVEVLVVLLLVAVLTALAGPSLSAYVGGSKTRRAVDRIATDLAYARMQAVRSGRHVVVRFDPSGSYRVEVVGDAEAPPRHVTLANEHGGILLSAPVDSLEFDARGLVVSDPGRGIIVVSHGEQRDSLLITPAGRVYRDF